jgi:dephospho-CoA kinase
MKVILCTGGIGSGKSYVIRLLNELGVPSYDCDVRAKALYDEDPQLLDDVARIAGGQVVRDGRLDRTALASAIFSDNAILSKIEAVVHPAVARDFDRWKTSTDAPLVVIESAIMLEKPALSNMYDYVLAVVAPEEVRIGRAMARDGSTKAQVRARMANQWSDAQRAESADFVLNNDGKSAILPQVLIILNKISNGKGR